MFHNTCTTVVRLNLSPVLKSFVYRHHLSGQAQTDLLRLFQLLLPTPNTLPRSLYMFHKGECISEDITRHYYCTRCSSLVEDPISVKCVQMLLVAKSFRWRPEISFYSSASRTSLKRSFHASQNACFTIAISNYNTMHAKQPTETIKNT